MSRFLRRCPPRLALLAVLVTAASATGDIAGAQDSATAAETRARKMASIRAEIASEDPRRIAFALHAAIDSGFREIAVDLPELLRKLSSGRPPASTTAAERL